MELSSAIRRNQTQLVAIRRALWMELAQWRLRREGAVLVGAFGRMRMGELVDDAARVVVTLEGIHVGEAWEGRGRGGEHWHVLRVRLGRGRLAPFSALSGTIRIQSDGHR